MSILIKGAKMPSAGNWITVFIYSNGVCVFPDRQGGCKSIEGVNAVEIPPHGRLIDASVMAINFNCRDIDITTVKKLHEWLMEIPTVIESEVQEDV